MCTTCGACFGICPVGAINYEETVGGFYFPVVDSITCFHCGLCYEICPGIHFGKTLIATMPEDPFVGTALKSFVGRASDKQIFENSQSGGIVSGLLLNAIETGRVKGAVTVTIPSSTLPRPTIRIAQNRQEIIEAQKSKYCPVPLLCFLRELKNFDGPLAVVGTPCQIHGLINVLDSVPGLRAKIGFTIGLLCDRVMSYAALDYLCKKAVSNNDGTNLSFHFRDKSVNDYPGDVHVFSEKDGSIVMPAKIRKQIKNYFTPARCRVCFDKMNVFSDISVGDPHGLKEVDRKNGESILVVRTKLGNEVVQTAKSSGAITIRPAKYVHILKGQRVNKKRTQWRGYAEAWKKHNEPPNYYNQVKKYTSKIGTVKKYNQDLQYSMNLDTFCSREKLLKFVDKAIRKKQRLNRLFFPVYFVRTLLRKQINGN